MAKQVCAPSFASVEVPGRQPQRTWYAVDDCDNCGGLADRQLCVLAPCRVLLRASRLRLRVPENIRVTMGWISPVASWLGFDVRLVAMGRLRLIDYDLEFLSRAFI